MEDNVKVFNSVIFAIVSYTQEQQKYRETGNENKHLQRNKSSRT